MIRIAVGGFLHETNTFAPTKATFADFQHGGGWPAMTQGPDVLKVMRRINVGLAGFVDRAETHGWELVPTIACGASPSAHVTRDAFERIVKVMVDGIAAAGPIDAVYLDLHGAMVTEHLDDGEGEILARVRRVIGKDIPLVASLDLHANVTPEMMEHADALIAYRTYPHVDMAETGRACAQHLTLLLKTKQRFAKAFRQLPFLIPISWQCTNDQPTKGIYEKLAALESDAVPTLSFAPGFPAADFRDCGPSVFAYGKTQADADRTADAIVKLIESHEDDFDGKIWSPDDGVRHAMELSKGASKPIIIADTQDNPGAGGGSDTTGMLRALVRNKASAATGAIYDPESAKAVSLCRHRADRREDFGQQELGAFPRRFRADRGKADDPRCPRRDARGHGYAAVDAPAAGHPHQAERPGFHSFLTLTGQNTCPQSSASTAMPTNSLLSGATCTPIRKSASRKCAPPASSRTS
ncbi:microcystin degradation protein MlrC [Bradyrhizobium sp. F1.13.3]